MEQMVTLYVALNDGREAVDIAKSEEWAFMSEGQRQDIINKSILNLVQTSVAGDISKAEALQIKIKGVESTLSGIRKAYQRYLDNDELEEAREIQSRWQHLEQLLTKYQEELRREKGKENG